MQPQRGVEIESPARSRRRIWRFSERIVLALGLVLMATYGAAMLHRTIGSSVALSRFEAGPAPQRSSAHADGVDFSLWSPKRMKAYRGSLALIQDEPMAMLAISRLRIKAPVFAGTDDLVLNRGVGWIPGTARPGEPGNSGIAGHRDGFFRALKDVAVGDAVELETRQSRLTYRVDDFKIVNPDNVGVLRSRGTMSLTLVTCFPFYFAGNAPQRFIVHAKLEKQTAVITMGKGGTPRSEAATLIFEQ